MYYLTDDPVLRITSDIKTIRYGYIFLCAIHLYNMSFVLLQQSNVLDSTDSNYFKALLC